MEALTPADPVPLLFKWRESFLWGPFAQEVNYDRREAREFWEPIEDEL